MTQFSLDRLRESMVKILHDNGDTAGSGFIIREDGYVITCHHVIYQLESLRVEYGGNIHPAQWCEQYSQPDVDLAVLKIAIASAQPVTIINPENIATSVKVYGFPKSKEKNFDGFDFAADNIDPSTPVKVISTYTSRELKYTNPWNKLPQEKATFKSHRVTVKVDPGTSGGAVFSEELGGVVGVIQCSKSDESYVIRWDNFTDVLEQLDLEPRQKAVCQFFKEIEDTFNRVRLFHIPQEKAILLKDQYVPIQVTLERVYTHQIETNRGYLAPEMSLSHVYALKGRHFKEELEQKERKEKIVVDWKEAKKEAKNLMVLADPGMGKSTLLQMETVNMAQSELQKLKDKVSDIDEVVFPLLIRLSELDKHRTEIMDNIVSIIEKNYSIDGYLGDLLREKLARGKCLLLLDALDEVPKERRLDLQERLKVFSKKYPCQIIMTSRIVGYSGAAMGDIKEVEIVPFSQSKTEEYINTWFVNAQDYLEDETVTAAKLIEELKQRPQIQGLAQNPLLLSLVCSLYQTKGLTLPARRVQVYHQAVSYILSQWCHDNQRQAAETGWIVAKNKVLEYLAYQFSCNNQEEFSAGELWENIEGYLQKNHQVKDFRDITTTALIRELTEDDGIIQKSYLDGDKYLFLHRTFQEYFTASYLKGEIEKNQREGIKLVTRHLWQNDWHETIILVAGLLKEPIPLLTAITREKDDIFKTLLLLAGLCITECRDQSHPVIIKIVKKIGRFWRSYYEADFLKSVLIALGKIGNQQVIELLIAALHDSHDGVRYYVAEALGEIGNQQAVEPLLAALHHSNDYLRSKAAKALGKIGDRQIGNQQTVEPLIAALHHSELWVRMNAVEALEKIGNQQAVQALFAAFNGHESLFIRMDALKALQKIESRQAVEASIAALHHLDVEALIAALHHSDYNVRSSAAEALGKIGNQPAVEALIAALYDSGYNVRSSAAEALGKIGNQQAVEALIAALHDSDIIVRKNAAEALGKIGNQQAVEALIAALHDSDKYVRRNAAEALENIGTPETLKKLIRNWNINIYDPDIFVLAQKLAIRYSRQKLPFIPVYPHLVRFSYSPILATVSRLLRGITVRINKP